MKKLLCFCVIISAGFALYAFDRSLNGSYVSMKTRALDGEGAGSRGVGGYGEG